MSSANQFKKIVYERYYNPDKMRFMGKPLSEVKFDSLELGFVYKSLEDLKRYEYGKFEKLKHEREQEKDDSGMIINWE